MKQLFLFLNSIHSMPPAVGEELGALLKQYVFRKGTPLLLEGHLCRQILFIEKGFVTISYWKGDREVISWLLGEGSVCISPKAFFMQVASIETIIAREDSVMWGISYDQLFKLFTESHDFLWIGFKILLGYYLGNLNKDEDTVHLSNTERYQLLYAKAPELFKWGRMKYIAAYLGMSIATLNKIRKDLGHRMNQKKS